MTKNIREAYAERLPLIRELATILERETLAALAGVKHVDRVYFRAKSENSFAEKATEDPDYYEHPLSEIEDQVAGRVLVFFLPDIDVVVARLKETFGPVEVTRKRPSEDSEFGYESHHSVFNIPPHLKPTGWDVPVDMPKTFELQVRTLFMHAWAEPQHDLGYKGAIPLQADVRRELYWTAASAWGSDQAFRRVLLAVSQLPAGNDR